MKSYLLFEVKSFLVLGGLFWAHLGSFPPLQPSEAVPWKALLPLAAEEQKFTEAGGRGRFPAQPSPVAGRAGRCRWPRLQMDNAVPGSWCVGRGQ